MAQKMNLRLKEQERLQVHVLPEQAAKTLFVDLVVNLLFGKYQVRNAANFSVLIDVSLSFVLSL
jgi:hypothetical protein